MYDVLRFWLELGVDGFRVDVIWHLMKDARVQDNPPNLDYRQGQPEIDRWLPIHSADQSEGPRGHRRDAGGGRRYYPHRVLIGEILSAARSGWMAILRLRSQRRASPSLPAAAKRRGRLMPLPGSSKNTRRPFALMAPGPTGCSATTTGTAHCDEGWARSRRRSLLSCC